MAFDQQFQFMAILDPDGTISRVNDFPLNRLGLERENYVGKPFWELPEWDHLEHFSDKVRRHIKQAVLSDKPVRTIELVHLKDGNSLYADTIYSAVRGEDGQAQFILVQAMDITKYKLATKALQESEERFERFANAAYEGMGIAVNGIVQDVNRRLCEMTEFSRDEIVNGHILNLIHPEDHAIVAAHIKSESEEMYVFRFLTKNQRTIWAEVRSAYVMYKGQRARVSALYDITNRKLSEEALKESQAQLRKINGALIESNRKLEATNKELETFSYSVSHDLKAPLRALQGFSASLNEKYGDKMDETANRWIRFIRDNAQRMDDLISDVLAFSRISRTKIKHAEIDTNTMVRNIVERELSSRTHPAEFKISDLPKSFGDPTMLEIVWQNLIDNSLKYSSTNYLPYIEISGRETGDKCIYSIQDNGVGFDMRHYDKLFGIFQRLHGNDEFHGTGVGLASVCRIIQKHGGEISAEGEVGKGATFEFILPK